MITIRDIAEFVGAVTVMVLMGWLLAWAVVYCLDKEAAQVREGLKDARTAVLTVPLTK